MSTVRKPAECKMGIGEVMWLVGWKRPWVSEGPKDPGGMEGGIEDS